MYPPDANLIFAKATRAAHQRAHAAGAVYLLNEGDLDHGDPDEMLEARLVCDWSATREDTDAFLRYLQG